MCLHRYWTFALCPCNQRIEHRCLKNPVGEVIFCDSYDTKELQNEGPCSNHIKQVLMYMMNGVEPVQAVFLMMKNTDSHVSIYGTTEDYLDADGSIVAKSGEKQHIKHDWAPKTVKPDDQQMFISITTWLGHNIEALKKQVVINNARRQSNATADAKDVRRDSAMTPASGMPPVTRTIVSRAHPYRPPVAQPPLQYGEDTLMGQKLRGGNQLQKARDTPMSKENDDVGKGLERTDSGLRRSTRLKTKGPVTYNEDKLQVADEDIDGPVSAPSRARTEEDDEFEDADGDDDDEQDSPHVKRARTQHALPARHTSTSGGAVYDSMTRAHQTVQRNPSLFNLERHIYNLRLANQRRGSSTGNGAITMSAMTGGYLGNNMSAMSNIHLPQQPALINMAPMSNIYLPQQASIPSGFPVQPAGPVQQAQYTPQAYYGQQAYHNQQLFLQQQGFPNQRAFSAGTINPTAFIPSRPNAFPQQTLFQTPQQYQTLQAVDVDRAMQNLRNLDCPEPISHAAPLSPMDLGHDSPAHLLSHEASSHTGDYSPRVDTPTPAYRQETDFPFGPYLRHQ